MTRISSACILLLVVSLYTASLFAVSLFASCNSGLALLGGLSDSGESGNVNTAPVLASPNVFSSRTSPLVVEFVVSDAELDPVDLEVRFDTGSGVMAPATLLAGMFTDEQGVQRSADTNLIGLETAAGGFTHYKLWAFDQDGLGPGLESVELQLEIVGGGGSSLAPFNPAPLSVKVGNDAPVITPLVAGVDIGPEETGIVVVPVTISDSSGDAVVVKFEYRLVDDPSCGDWQLARPAEIIDPCEPTPEFGLDTDADPDGSEEVFFWDTTYDLASCAGGGDVGCGLTAVTRQVEMRLTALEELPHPDDTGLEASMETGAFLVDNNDVPIASISNEAFVLNPDQRLGVPVPFVLFDTEGDEVGVVLQWRRLGETFEPLPQDVAGLNALLDDPAERALRRICTELAPTFEGVVSLSPDGSDPAFEVRLGELGGLASGALASGLGGRVLDLFRVSGLPEPLPLDSTGGSAVAAAALEEGLEALVLAGDGASWTLSRHSLATGATIGSDLATDAGAPLALALSFDESIAFVAGSSAGVWSVTRVDLESASQARFDAASAGELRGIAALDDTTVLVTVDDALLRVRFDGANAQVSTMLSELDVPWGVVVDRARSNRALVAEHGSGAAPGRVLEVELDTGNRHPIAARIAPEDRASLGTVPFPRPRAVALERDGRRALVMTEPAVGVASLRAVDRLGAVDLDGMPGPDPFVHALGADLGDPSASLATGAHGLRLLALPGTSPPTVAPGGGLLQRRAVVPEPAAGGAAPAPYEPRTQVVRVTEAFAPSPVVNTPWRITAPLTRVVGGPLGEEYLFVWDTSEVAGGGEVLLRLTPYDTDVGIPDSGLVTKEILGGHEREEPTIVDLLADSEVTDVHAADIDGDGDLELVVADQEDRLFVVQYDPGESDPLILTLEGTIPPQEPRSVDVADLNDDQLPDIVSANIVGDDLTVFFQQAGDPLSFGEPLSIGGPVLTNGPRAVVAADLDGDGLTDLVSACEVGNQIVLFFQDPSSPGAFLHDPATDALGGPTTTEGAFSVSATDVDGDGLRDLVSANVDADSLTIFYSNGDGTYGVPNAGAFDPDVTLDPSSSGAQIGEPRSVIAVDLDRDGRCDLAAANTATERIVLFYGAANALGFTHDPAQDTLGQGNENVGLWDVVAEDLDGDGDLDLLAANSGGGTLGGGNNVAIYFQTSPRVFERDPQGPIGTAATTTQVRSVVAADMDGNGTLDLVAGSEFDGHVALYSAPTPGSFEPGDPLGNNFVTGRPVVVVAADLDGDADRDLATVNLGLPGQSVGNLTVFEQVRPGTFDPTPLELGNDGAAVRPKFLATGDLDGDGDLDLVSANRGASGTFEDSNLTIFHQTAPGVFAQDPLVLGDMELTFGAEAVNVIDLDGDGAMDIVSSNLDGDDLTIFYQDPAAPGVFGVDLGGDLIGPNQRLGGSDIMDSPGEIVAVDLDGNGFVDLVSTNRGFNGGDPPVPPTNLGIFFQTAPRTFDAPIFLENIGTGNTTFVGVHAANADLDGDGLQDLLVTNFAHDVIYIFYQDATLENRFPAEPVELGDQQSLNSPSQVAAADLDGDGDLDIACVNRNGDDVSVFWQASPRRFDPTPLRLGDGANIVRPRTLALVDVDGDGTIDVVSCNQNSNNITVFSGFH